MKPKYKATVVIWSDFDPMKVELVDLARQATDGVAIVSSMLSERVERPEDDPEFAGAAEFFGGFEESEEADGAGPGPQPESGVRMLLKDVPHESFCGTDSDTHECTCARGELAADEEGYVVLPSGFTVEEVLVRSEEAATAAAVAAEVQASGSEVRGRVKCLTCHAEWTEVYPNGLGGDESYSDPNDPKPCECPSQYAPLF
jgi:hypothetical protein